MTNLRPTGHCPYWIAGWVRDVEAGGWRPDFPGKAGFLLLADARRSRSGIYECDLPRSRAKGRRIAPLDNVLCALIESGKRYPPALALARNDVTRAFAETAPSRADLRGKYAEALRARLNRQADAPYVLVEAARDEIGYLRRGEWYWVLRLRTALSGIVASWVSDDYFVYENPVEDFVLGASKSRRERAAKLIKQRR